jgi:hypothetical protein
MKTQRLLEILRSRGLKIVVNRKGEIVLRGPRAEATPLLLKVAAIHKPALLEAIKKTQGKAGKCRKEATP